MRSEQEMEKPWNRVPTKPSEGTALSTPGLRTPGTLSRRAHLCLGRSLCSTGGGLLCLSTT